MQEFTRQTDAHHRSLFNADTLNLWISFYCDFYGAVMLVAVGMFAVSQRDRGAANVGLAFSNTIQLLVFYTWTLRLVTEAISLSSSVEQITWLAHHTPIDGKDDINNAGTKLESAHLASPEKPNQGSLPFLTSCQKFTGCVTVLGSGFVVPFGKAGCVRTELSVLAHLHCVFEASH